MVVKILRDVKPWRITGFYIKAVKVLEVKSGSLPACINEGDEVEIVCTK